MIHQNDVTVLIDFEKYQQLFKSSIRGISVELNSNETSSHECVDIKNEVYQKCGSNCVLGCRHDSVSSKVAVSNGECDSNKCIEGCFCRDGFVRYQNKCVPVNECPHRRNKAIEIMTKDGILSENETPIQNLTQSNNANNQNETQNQANSPNPKIFGFFNRPGCGFGGCGTVPIPAQIQSYDEEMAQRNDNKHSGFSFFLFAFCNLKKLSFRLNNRFNV